MSDTDAPANAAPADDGDPGESVTLSAPPKVEARGKFSSEVLTKLAELRRNPIIDDGDSLELVKDTPPVKSAPVPAPKIGRAHV